LGLTKAMLDRLDQLLEAYASAPEIYHAGRYWKNYEDKIYNEIKSADLGELRSGQYPIFGTFGFSEAVYHYPPHIPFWKKTILKGLRSLPSTDKIFMPYNLNLKDIREMAFRHCKLVGRISNATPLENIETSTYGSPNDLFAIDGKNYTLQFLSYYLRYCFIQKERPFRGDEIIVELGSGSGFQIEVLKKMYPDLTILCFDLPSPLFLCEHYLEKVFPSQIASATDHMDIDSLQNLEKGKIHMFGNWQFPLLKDFSFDIFWNAASFGEMEPNIVSNYLSFIQSESIYLLQARKGKESSSTAGVKNKILFEDYNQMLNGYNLLAEADVYQAHRRLSQSGGYFQGLWKKN